MISNLGHVMTLANSIIGVGILAMPFCFQKCGIILSIFLLVLSNYLTRISCHFLVKSSILTRRKSFEFLAFHAFGSSGKLMVELCIIGYLIGTCIAYFVVVGDLGPQIIAKLFNMSESDKLRTWVMVIVTIICIIPLGLLRNVDSLAAVCTASIVFYLCLVIKIIFESSNHLLDNDWEPHVVYWEPSGVLQCLPIFSMALSCQMQLFEVCETLFHASLDKVNKIVKNATAICTVVYIFVGFFGYVAFCKQTFAGNILMNFSPSLASDVIKIGFVLSVAFSFPLVIFPCRASIYSLLYRKGHGDASKFIPESKFKLITITIVISSLFVGLLIPSIELVIGLVGSTIGVAICILFPASCFMKVSKKDSTEKLLAQFIFVSGFCLMILGTYANLNAIDEKHSGPSVKETVKKLEDSFIENNIKNLNNLSTEKLIFKDGLKPADYPLNLENDVRQIDIKSATISIQEKPTINIENEKEVKKEELRAVRKKPLGNDKIIDTDIPKPVKIIETSKNPKIMTSNSVINKDAIKKEEEIVAEEAEKETDELKKKDDELERTKKLYEQKVKEIQEEVAKRNRETENIVLEKFVELAQEVGKANINLLNENKEEIKVVNALKKSEGKVIDAVKQDVPSLILESNLTKLVQQVDLAKNIKSNNHIEAIRPELLIKTEKADFPDKTKNKPVVYEPKSYQEGERINQEKIQPERLSGKNIVLPVPMLLNSSLQASNMPKVIENKVDNVNLGPLPEKPKVKEVKTLDSQVDSKPEIKPNKQDAEMNVIRRDILEAVTENSEIPATNSNNENKNMLRDKRSIDTIICNQWDMGPKDCLDKILSEVPPLKNLINAKLQTFGRDLKSIKTNRD